MKKMLIAVAFLASATLAHAEDKVVHAANTPAPTGEVAAPKKEVKPAKGHHEAKPEVKKEKH
jgi:hypothetical protein